MKVKNFRLFKRPQLQEFNLLGNKDHFFNVSFYPKSSGIIWYLGRYFRATTPGASLTVKKLKNVIDAAKSLEIFRTEFFEIFNQILGISSYTFEIIT